VRVQDWSGLANSLLTQGWASCRGLVADPLLARLRQDAGRHESSARFRPAMTGRGDNAQTGILRGDSSLWLTDPLCDRSAQEFLDELEVLRVELNRRLMLGMESIQAHYACYPAGTGYVRHRDRFRGDDSRVLSLLCYLNPDWPEHAGGALRLHLPGGAVDFAPRMGTIVMFLSDEVEHEVLPATQPRFSIAAWFLRSARL
jgi:SM-20-related protein